MRPSHLLATVTVGILASASVANAEPCDPPRILIVIDSSSSMLDTVTEGGVTSQKWQVAQSAVKAVTDQYPAEARYGLMAFPGPTGKCSTGTVLVDIGANTGPQVQSTLTALDMTGSRQTPAGQSLMAASNYAGITETGKKNYVVFLTDGWQYCSIATSSAPVCAQSADCTLMGASPCPTCNSCNTGSSDPACSGKTTDGCYCVRNWPVLGVTALATGGVKTYVVRFGSNADYKTLNAAAEAGGTALAGCDPTSSNPSCYYQAGAPSELNTALGDIIQKVVTEVCNGDCGIQGTRTCNASGWSPCAAPTEIDCKGPCGASGKQQCVGGSLTKCDAICNDSGAGGAGGTGTGGKGGAGGASGGAGKGGSNATGGGGSGGTGKGGSTPEPDAGLGGMGLGGPPAADEPQSGDDGGCGCRTAGQDNTPRSLVMIALALGATFLTRKRRRI